MKKKPAAKKTRARKDPAIRVNEFGGRGGEHPVNCLCGPCYEARRERWRAGDAAEDASAYSLDFRIAAAAIAVVAVVAAAWFYLASADIEANTDRSEAVANMARESANALARFDREAHEHRFFWQQP